MDGPGFLRDTIASSSKSIERPATRQSDPRSSDLSFDSGNGSLRRSSLKRYSIIEGGEIVQGTRRDRDRERRRNRLSSQDLAEIVGDPEMIPAENKSSSSSPPQPQKQDFKEGNFMTETVRNKSVTRRGNKSEAVWSTGLAEKNLNFDQQQRQFEIADRAHNSVRDKTVRIASPESVRSTSSMSSINGPPLLPPLVAYETSAAKIRQGGRRIVDKCGLGSHDSLDALRLYTKENFEVLHQAQTRLAEYIGLVCQDLPERQSELTRRVRQLEVVAKDDVRIIKKIDQLGRDIGMLDQNLGVLYNDTQLQASKVQGLNQAVSEVSQQGAQLSKQFSQLEATLAAIENKSVKNMTHFCDQLVRCETKFKADVWYLDDVISDVEDSLNQVLVRLETAGITGVGANEVSSNYGSSP